MLPTLPGIRELLKVMRSDVFFYNMHSDILTQSGIQYDHENDLVNPGTCETAISTSDGCRDSPQDSPPKPTYTMLTSKTKLDSTKLVPRQVPNTDTHRGSSLSTIPEVPKTIPRPANNVLQNTNTVAPAIPNIHQTLNTEPNVFPKLTINPKSCNLDAGAKFQNILPKPVYTVIISNTARPESNTAFPTLYQLLKPNISVACSSMTSVNQTPKSLYVVPVLNQNVSPATTKLQPTSYIQLYPVLNSNNASAATKISSSLPVFAVSTPSTKVSKRNCVIEGQDCPSQPELKSTHPISTLKSSSGDTIIQPSSSQSVSSPKSAGISSSSKPEKTRITRKPRSKQVNISIPQTGQCDGNLSDVKVELSREELWKLFHEEGNEMIVSKQGRPLFPTLDMKVSGFCPDKMYSVAVKFVCVDKYRYYFDTSRESWDQTRQIQTADHSKCFEHSESPASGKVWNKKQLEFGELRLINRSTNVKNMVFAPTMRKHCAQVVVTMLQCSRCHAKHTRHINIPLTEFIAVSSYYSLKISQLKIAHNPMAKMRAVTYPRKRKNRQRKSAENIPTNQTKKQKIDADPASSFDKITQITLSESIRLTIPNNKTSSTTPSTQVSTVSDLATSSVLPSASSSQPSAILTPYVFHSTTPSTSTSQLPIMSGLANVCTPTIKRTTVISSTIKLPENQDSLSQTMARSEYSNVLTCPTTKPKAHIQSDEDILGYIETYLSPFQTSEKDEAFDSSIFDELTKINCISDKLNSFDDLDFVLTNVAEC
ncbi:uncharacterized protein LOC114530264 [Dendronephthya gigantea]|uniref:uncharacterized protein LOC114530264 n=1 Tax=Dendronephthya gigantea TaxID=151771 RepID=UPI00106C0BF3|nr:uncharacterized protein LOC114530264 [Dendronephthya gigantea]